MKNEFKNGELITYVPEIYDLQYAVFLHKIRDKAFIRLCDTHEVKKVELTKIHPHHEATH